MEGSDRITSEQTRLREIKARLDEITVEQVAGRGNAVELMREKLELIDEMRSIRKSLTSAEANTG